MLTFNEIIHNSQTAYMLNKNTIKIGQHLICVVLEDLLKIQNDTSLCLSLNNQRISGRLQFPSTLLVEQELQSFEIDDDKFVVLGKIKFKKVLPMAF